MKANELRIYNYIGNKYYLDRVYDTIGVNYNDVEYKYMGGVGFFNIKDAIPILLTEEWLLKFGFEFKGKCISKNWFYLWKDGSKIVFALAEMQEETGTYLEIKYVHQLQNLYWCICGEELEIKLQ